MKIQEVSSLNITNKVDKNISGLINGCLLATERHLGLGLSLSEMKSFFETRVHEEGFDLMIKDSDLSLRFVKQGDDWMIKNCEESENGFNVETYTPVTSELLHSNFDYVFTEIILPYDG